MKSTITTQVQHRVISHWINVDFDCVRWQKSSSAIWRPSSLILLPASQWSCSWALHAFIWEEKLAQVRLENRSSRVRSCIITATPITTQQNSIVFFKFSTLNQDNSIKPAFHPNYRKRTMKLSPLAGPVTQLSRIFPSFAEHKYSGCQNVNVWY